jgi:hypothetical protein
LGQIRSWHFSDILTRTAHVLLVGVDRNSLPRGQSDAIDPTPTFDADTRAVRFERLF